MDAVIRWVNHLEEISALPVCNLQYSTMTTVGEAAIGKDGTK